MVSVMRNSDIVLENWYAYVYVIHKWTHRGEIVK